MGKIIVKRFDEPDEVVSLPGNLSKVVTLGETYVSWSVIQPGWRWSKDVKQLVGTPSCQVHHQGVVISGIFKFLTDVALLEGSGLTFSDAGEHELKGFEGARKLYRFASDDTR